MPKDAWKGIAYGEALTVYLNYPLDLQKQLAPLLKRGAWTYIDILNLFEEGQRVPEICESLGLSEETVSFIVRFGLDESGLLGMRRRFRALRRSDLPPTDSKESLPSSDKKRVVMRNVAQAVLVYRQLDGKDRKDMQPILMKGLPTYMALFDAIEQWGTYEEIANCLGLHYNTVRQLIYGIEDAGISLKKGSVLVRDTGRPSRLTKYFS